MIRTVSVFVLGLSLAACQRDDSKVGEKLDQIAQRLDSIEKQLASGAGAKGAMGAAGQRGQGGERKRPDPNKVYAVPATGPTTGAKQAKVTIVEGFEFACPYCEKVRPTVAQILKDYPNDVKVVHKQYVVHPQHATIPALSACAAEKQGKYAQMEELIWEKGFKAGRNLSQENMDKLAAEVGLDVKKFKADSEGVCKGEVQKGQAELAQVGVGGTPAFFINGRFLSGARPVEQFKALIDEELKKANERIGKDGTTAANYYDKWVVEKGEKKL